MGPRVAWKLAEHRTEFYFLGSPYITTKGDTAYFVVMSKEPTIDMAAPEEEPL
jgi:hypothetical protein